ncbi:MAG TPA: AmmeMemoRadiSam system protein A, partial [Gammaproteobacteria bacterium]|nr:AmmeMemoRadiSam system protein A [Gammaproteobacteria bacterium]
MSGLDPVERNSLLRLARESIAYGLDNGGRPPGVALDMIPSALRRPAACFVTLTNRGGALRGCIGTMEAKRALALEIADRACAAAFQDPRFPPVAAGELGELFVGISVLGPRELMDVGDDGALIAA